MNVTSTNTTTMDAHGEDSTRPYPSYNNQTLPTTINVNSWDEDNVTGTNVPVTEVEVVPCEYTNLQWDKCDFDENGRSIGVFGKLWMQLSVAKLRIICRKLQVYGVKNVRKEGIVEAIGKTYHNSQAYTTIQKTLNEQSTITPTQPLIQLFVLIFLNSSAAFLISSVV
jgi:hypothetical protein